MALLDAGLPARRIRVDAIDISERALERARHGVYAKNAFRGVDLGFRERHFEITGEGARISDVVRDCVHFQQGNLLDTGLLAAAPVYGVIYSRNLLIYFDPPAQRRAAQALRRMLSPAGWLFVGPSEPPLLTAHGFALARLPMAFALRAPLEQSAPPATKTVGKSDPSAARRGVARSAMRSGRAPPVANDQPAPRVAISSLEAAQGLANRGQLVEAERLCDDHIRQHAPSAEAYCLLGVIRDTIGNRQAAAEAYRKAIYLDPNHYEALVHLALLVKGQGNVADARMLAERGAPRG